MVLLLALLTFSNMQFNTKMLEIEKYPIGEPVQTFTSIHWLQTLSCGMSDYPAPEKQDLGPFLDCDYFWQINYHQNLSMRLLCIGTKCRAWEFEWRQFNSRIEWNGRTEGCFRNWPTDRHYFPHMISEAVVVERWALSPCRQLVRKPHRWNFQVSTTGSGICNIF